MFRGVRGVPQIYGVIMRQEEAEIFQEFAGKKMSLCFALYMDGEIKALLDKIKDFSKRAENL